MTQRIYLVHSDDGKIGPSEFRNQPLDVGSVFCVQSDGTVGLNPTTFANITGIPTDNPDLSAELDSKIDKISIIDSETTSNECLWSSDYVKGKINALTAVASIRVVDVYPENPVESTMYYVGTAQPFHIYFYVNGTKYDFGETPLDMGGFLKTSGGTMTGDLVFKNGKKNTDYLLKTGGTMSGGINLNGNMLTNLYTNVWSYGNDDAITKRFLQSRAFTITNVSTSQGPKILTSSSMCYRCGPIVVLYVDVTVRFRLNLQNVILTNLPTPYRLASCVLVRNGNIYTCANTVLSTVDGVGKLTAVDDIDPGHYTGNITYITSNWSI